MFLLGPDKCSHESGGVKMARGWESKAVEQQQDLATGEDAGKMKAVTPEQQQRQRTIANLQLKRQQILDTKTSHPARRSALQQALADCEQQLGDLGQRI
jgi:hypothetical protein